MASALVTQIPRIQETFAKEVVNELFLVPVGQVIVECALIRTSFASSSAV